jgi:hypothetical protein
MFTKISKLCSEEKETQILQANREYIFSIQIIVVPRIYSLLVTYAFCLRNIDEKKSMFRSAIIDGFLEPQVRFPDVSVFSLQLQVGVCHRYFGSYVCH